MIVKIIEKIDEVILRKGLCIVGIDGCGGSGKTTLAETIVSRYGSGQIVHMDNFYKLSGQRNKLVLDKINPGFDYNIKRLIKEVFDPIYLGLNSRYQIYDWVEDKLTDWLEIKPKGLITIERVYSICNQLYNKYDIKIFVECNRELRLIRGLERDGNNAHLFWKKWMENEDKYLEEQKTQTRVDFIVSGEVKY